MSSQQAQKRAAAKWECKFCILDALTSRPRGATSNRMRSFAFVDGEVTLENTPFSFTMIYDEAPSLT
jgi:hypothetical protein